MLFMEDINCWEQKFEPCIYSDKLLNKISVLNRFAKFPVDEHEIKKASYYARKYHGSQRRQSGEPYYSHPLEVACMFAEFTAENAPNCFITSLIQVAILHDTIEDTELSEIMIQQIFNHKVGSQVEDLTRIKPYGKISSKTLINLLIQQKKYQVALIKVFDRIHNLQTLSVKSLEKAEKIIKETLMSFIILAAYLEIRCIEKQLLNICNNFIKKNFNFAQSKTLSKIILPGSHLGVKNDVNNQ